MGTLVSDGSFDTDEEEDTLGILDWEFETLAEPVSKDVIV